MGHFGLRALALLVLPGLANAASFFGLGDLQGGDFISSAQGVSADGSVVVGYSYSAEGQEAFRWTARRGMEGLGDLRSGPFASSALGVSADGSVVVGQGANADYAAEAFRLKGKGRAMRGIGSVSGGTYANAASANGSVVVGYGGTGAFRWTSGGMTRLDMEDALGVSADGSVVVGYGPNSSGVIEASRWVGGITTGLGDLPGGTLNSQAYDVSADGSVVVGYSSSSLGYEPFLWSGGVMTGLGMLPGANFGIAQAVSGDGTVVGWYGGSSATAFVWTASDGMEPLYDLLVSRGATGLAGWSGLMAYDISDDGNWIVGVGMNPLSMQEAFLATIVPEAFLANVAPVPAPAAVWLLGTGLAGLCGRRWLRRKAAACRPQAVRTMGR